MLLRNNYSGYESILFFSNNLFAPFEKTTKGTSMVHGDPVTQTLGSQCMGPGFDPWSGNY